MDIIEKMQICFADRIDDILKQKHWSIKQFAEFVGIPRTTVNSWVLKKKLPRIDLVYRIADIFNLTIDFLMGREE